MTSGLKALNPTTLRAPFAAYSHGTEVSGGMRLIRTSGQLGVRADDTVPDTAFDQAVICFDALCEILAAGGMSADDVVHVSGYVTAREHMAGYMKARDAFLGQPTRLPSRTTATTCLDWRAAKGRTAAGAGPRGDRTEEQGG